MKSKFIEHILSILFVTGVLCVLFWIINGTRETVRADGHGNERVLGDLSFVETSDRFQRALLSDVVDVFYPGQHDRNIEMVQQALLQCDRDRSERMQTSHLTQKLNGKKFLQLAVMYTKFLLVYVVVMVLTYYGVQTLAIWLFVYERRPPATGTVLRRVGRVAVRAAGMVASLVLFSPAYVIAYSMRTELNTDTTFFMTLLAVISNGLLIVYATKFLTFLETESRKGYVETAVVKNLRSSYALNAEGLSLWMILKPLKCFKGHIFEHIYRNARFQYLATVKEQAAFLITGLVIIEMALNIHGHLCYEMLRQMHYANYSIVIVILLLIFYTVKLTEVATDFLIYREQLRYGNTR